MQKVEELQKQMREKVTGSEIESTGGDQPLMEVVKAWKMGNIYEDMFLT